MKQLRLTDENENEQQADKTFNEMFSEWVRELTDAQHRISVDQEMMRLAAVHPELIEGGMLKVGELIEMLPPEMRDHAITVFASDNEP